MRAWEAPPLPARAAGRAKPVFVGRAAETAAAEQGWATVRSGARELIFIGGEPGAGKSRLVEELAAALHRRGAVVLMGTCSPEPGPPYEPFGECLEAAARSRRRCARVIRSRLSPRGAPVGLSLRPGQRAGLWRQGRGVPCPVGPRGRAEPGVRGCGRMVRAGRRIAGRPGV